MNKGQAIQPGSKVTVYQNGEILVRHGELIHRPQNQGETWQIWDLDKQTTIESSEGVTVKYFDKNDIATKKKSDFCTCEPSDREPIAVGEFITCGICSKIIEI